MGREPRDAPTVLHVGEEASLVREAVAAMATNGSPPSVTSVADGEGALNSLDRDAIDCVVCESELSDRSGVALLSAVRDRAPTLPCLFVTPDESLIDGALDAGATDVFVVRGESDEALLARRLDGLLSGPDAAGGGWSPSPREPDQTDRTEAVTDTLLDALDDVFYFVDGDGTVRLWNDALCEVTGYTDAEIEGRDALDFFRGEDRDRIADSVEETLDTGTSRVAADLVTSDGESIPFEFRGVRVADGEGNARGFVGIGRNVTERQRQQRQLECERDRVKTVFEAVPFPLVHVRFEDDTPVVQRINDAFESTFGVDSTSVAGEPLEDHVAAPDDEDAAGDVTARMLDGEAVEREVVRLAADGPQEFVVAGAPLELADDHVEGVAAYVDVTERNERIELLEQIRHNVGEVVWMTDPENRSMDFVSDAYEDVWGRSTASLCEEPQSFVEAVHPEDRDRVEAALAEQAENPDGYEETYRVIQPDGEVRWVHDQASGVYEDGELTQIVGVASDVTERRELETELREKASLLDHIFDQIPASLYVKDTDGRHLRISRFGIGDREEAIGKTDLEVYDGQLAEESYDDDLRVIEEGERIINKEEHNPATGEWLITSKVPWHVDGEINGLIGVTRDITEKKEYERRLRLQDRAIEEAPVGIAILDATSTSPSITYANPAFVDLAGREETADVEGQTISFLAGPDTDGRQLAALKSAVEAGDAASRILLLYRADGAPFWGRVTVAPVSDDQDTVNHLVAFLQDVTDTKEHAAEIERRLDEFADLLSEELRAPLRDAEMHLDAALDDGVGDDVEAARRSLRHVDKLIDDLAEVHSFAVKSRDALDSSAEEVPEQ